MAERISLGRAKIVKRRGPSFPFRNCIYWDCTPWGGGYCPVTDAPGAVILGTVMLDIRTGEVYSTLGVL
jgi:hypothetical protein